MPAQVKLRVVGPAWVERPHLRPHLPGAVEGPSRRGAEDGRGEESCATADRPELGLDEVDTALVGERDAQQRLVRVRHDVPDGREHGPRRVHEVDVEVRHGHLSVS